MAEKTEPSLTRETLRIYWDVSKKYWKSLLAMAALRPVYLASAYFASAYLAGLAIDKLTLGKTTSLWNDFGYIILGLVASGIIYIVVGQLTVKLIWKFETRVELDLYRLAIRRLLTESAHFHANHFAGSLVSQVNKFVSGFVRLSDTLYWQVYALVLNIGFTVFFLLPRLPLYTLILLLLLTVYFAISILLNKRARSLNKIRASAESDLTGQIADSIGNIMAVKSNSLEEHEMQRTEKFLASVQRSSETLRKYTTNKDTVLLVPLNMMTILAVVFSIYAAQKGLAPLSTLLLATAFTRDLLMRCVEFNITAQRNVARALGDANDMTAALLADIDIEDVNKPVPLKLGEGLLEFRDVDFHYYEKQHDVLFKNLSFRVRPGEKIGLVGPSGGGKTTITKLILRFMDVQGGQILIDGQDIAQVRQSDLRKVIGYVPQEPLLFHRSLAENIAYGKPDATHKEIVEAARLAHAHEFIEKLGNGYETLVGERGIKLSGGQKQRIAIARTILKSAPILVLDEATSALDSESEKYIQEALQKLMEGKTTIVIAHRLSTIARMDRIIVLDDGQIIEEGKHAELIQNNGVYANLWKHQSGGFLED